MQIRAVIADGNKHIRFEQKGLKVSGKNGADQSGARISGRGRSKIALNKERREEQEGQNRT